MLEHNKSQDNRHTVLPEIEDAHRALRRNADVVVHDPTRPLCHFLPPSGWMNDPNGTVYHNGYYHVFYQHNPYGDTWHALHWGHARSRDLVNWEHLPIALWPSDKHGEQSCYSGSCLIRQDGVPMLFYTRVQPKPEKHPREQWAATSDEEMIVWNRHESNPMLTVHEQGGPSIKGNWRDPYLFETEGRTFLVITAQLAESAGEDFGILLYEAADAQLDHWVFRNILLRKPGYELSFPECPNFVQLADQWVLLTSPYKPVEYHVGTFNLSTYTFTPHSHGRLDMGIDYYATNTAWAPDRRAILFAWIRGFRKGRGWNGCLALPRELALDADGRPITRPVEELRSLRDRNVASIVDTTLSEEEIVLPDTEPLECAEVECELSLGDASAIEIRVLRSADGNGGVSITYDGLSLDVHGTRIQCESRSDPQRVAIRLFVDRTVLEVFIDGGRGSATKVVYPSVQGDTISVRAHGGLARISRLSAWRLRPAEITPRLGLDVGTADQAG